jgi:hypothetical protein
MVRSTGATHAALSQHFSAADYSIGFLLSFECARAPMVERHSMISAHTETLYTDA